MNATTLLNALSAVLAGLQAVSEIQAALTDVHAQLLNIVSSGADPTQAEWDLLNSNLSASLAAIHTRALAAKATL
jgi:hypothetical protein